MFIAIVIIIAIISVMLSVRSLLLLKKRPEVSAIKKKLFKDKIIYHASSSGE